MLLALLAFRRRALLAAVLAVGLLPWMSDVQAQAPAVPASPPVQGTLWKRADQVQHQRLAEGAQAYRNGDFAGARRQFEGIDSDAGWYNLANALARQGNYDEAIAAYDRALALHPGMADAVANRAVVDAARKRKQSGGKGQDQQKPPQNGQQKPPQNGQGQQNPQGQQPQQGQQNPGQGQPQPGQQGSPGPVTTRTRRARSPASVAAMDSRRHHRWRMPRRRPRRMSSSASACSRQCSRHVRARANRMASPCQAATAAPAPTRGATGGGGVDAARAG